MDKQLRLTIGECEECCSEILTFFGKLPMPEYTFYTYYTYYTESSRCTSFFRHSKNSIDMYKHGHFNPYYKKVVCEECDTIQRNDM